MVKRLLPKLERGDIIIDNASFHKGEYIREIIESAGCEIWYLPPYSPDLNPIEQAWTILKKKVTDLLREVPTIFECLECFFKTK